jgi:hypothetical protein
MKSERFLLTFLLLIVCLSAQAQGYLGTFLFNMVDEGPPRRLITVHDITTRNIKFLSADSNSVITYDTVYNAFSFTTYGREQKYFGIVYKNDTIVINYPSYRQYRYYFFKSPSIPLNGNSYSFYNKSSYDYLSSKMRPEKPIQDAVLSREDKMSTDLFSEYGMEEKTKDTIKKHLIYAIEFKEYWGGW